MIFHHALAVMRQMNCDVFAPTSFQRYLREHEISARTAPVISVDSFDRLATELKEAGVMVFRLGQAAGERNTKFALARHKNGWSDYFLEDETIYNSIKEEVFIPSGSARDLYVFQLLPTLTETSFVNLALASGLLGMALNLDEPDRPVIPATGQSTFDFSVRPHPLIEAIWTHDRGQVEIDALFTSRRNGRETLFLVEAKTSTDLSTLAKHKIVYPLLALCKNLPSFFDIVPVYLRILRRETSLYFYVCECSMDRNHQESIASLVPTDNRRILVLHGFGV